MIGRGRQVQGEDTMEDLDVVDIDSGKVVDQGDHHVSTCTRILCLLEIFHTEPRGRTLRIASGMLEKCFMPIS